MAQLPLEQGIPRFKANEERIDTMTNGDEDATWTTSDGAEVPSIRKLFKEINTEGEGWLALAEDQAERAEDAADRIDLGALDDAVQATADDRVQTGQDVIASASNADRAEDARDAAIAAGAWDYTPIDDTALAAITGMTSGQAALVIETMHVWVYDGSDWVDTGESPLSAKADTSSLSITKAVGYLGSIPDGTTAATTGTFAMTTPIEGSGTGARFHYFGRGTGTVYALILSRSGNTMTVEDEVAISVTPGEHVVDLPTLEYSAGQFFGWRGPNGLLAVTPGVPEQGFRLWATSSLITEGNTYSAPTSSQAVPHFRFEITWQVVTGEAFAGLSDAALGAALQTGVIAPDEHLIGREGAPVTSSSGVGGSTYVYRDPAPYDMVLKRVDGYILTAGSMVLKAFDGDPELLVQNGEDQALTWDGTGLQSSLPAAPFFLRAGQRLGFYRGGASIAVNAGGPDSGGVYFASGNVSTLTSPSLNAAARIELSFEFDQLTLEERVSILEGGSTQWEPTSGFIIALIAGQSNAAGRGLAESAYEIEEGRGYHWSGPDAELVHLEDPTGNDSIALTGRASIGPSLAHAVLAATNGRIGVILVNAAVGSSSITSWLSGETNWTAASGMWNAAIADAVAKKLPIVGCCGLWLQGEQDTLTDMSAATYKGHLASVLDNLSALTGCGDQARMIGAMVGANTDPGEDVRYARIQSGQMALTREDARFILGHTGARFFRDRAMMQDTVHYTTPGYDEIGSALSTALLAHALGRIPDGVI